jgi:hypothetical protein
MMWVMWNLILVHLETVLGSVHSLHRMYHRLRKSFLTHPMELPDDVRHVESRFDLFGDRVSVGAR